MKDNRIEKKKALTSVNPAYKLHMNFNCSCMIVILFSAARHITKHLRILRHV